MAHWWEHTPPTNVAQVKIPATTLFVNCGLSLLLVRYLALRSLFPVLRVFPSLQKPTLSNWTRNGKRRTSTWICYIYNRYSFKKDITACYCLRLWRYNPIFKHNQNVRNFHITAIDFVEMHDRNAHWRYPFKSTRNLSFQSFFMVTTTTNAGPEFLWKLSPLHSIFNFGTQRLKKAISWGWYNSTDLECCNPFLVFSASIRYLLGQS